MDESELSGLVVDWGAVVRHASFDKATAARCHNWWIYVEVLLRGGACLIVMTVASDGWYV